IATEERISGNGHPASITDLPASPAKSGWRYRWLLLAFVGLALPIECVYHTAQDLSPAWTEGPLSPGGLGALALLGGVMAALLLLAVLLISQQLLLDPKAVSSDLLPFELSPWFQR